MKFIAIFVITAAVCNAAANTSKPHDPAARPNILMIITDQQFSGMMSCAGNPFVQTPNLDRLAAEGMRFASAYASNPVCVPSRYSLITGQYPSHITMENNDADRNPVSAEDLSHAMGEVFHQGGYETVYAGKVHLPGQAGVRANAKAYGFRKVIASADVIGRDPAVEECVKYLKQPHDKPFLLVASLINPHDICYMAIRDYIQHTGDNKWGVDATALHELDKALALPPGVSEKEFFDKICPPLPTNFEMPDEELSAILLDKKVDGAFIVWPRENWSEREWRLHRWAYARLTELVDAQIGKILDALKDAGLEDSTLVAMTSDHGDQDASHRLLHKGFLYEESIRIPLILRWNGVVKAGRVDREHLVCNGTDLLPTFCDFVGLPVSPSYPGRSLKPLLTDAKVDNWRQSLVIETQFARLVHMGSWKYMIGADPAQIPERYREYLPPHPVREVLVDLKTDPGEMHNAANASHQAQLETGRRLLRESGKKHDDRLRSRYELPAQ